MKLKKLVAAFCTVVMLFVVSGCNQALDLGLKVQKGDKYNTHMVNNQETLANFNNQEIKTNQIMDMNLSLEVKDIDQDKNVTIYYKYDSMKISSESASQKIEYDSEQDDENNPLSLVYGGIIGKGFTVKLDKKGQVLEIKGIDELLDSMVATIPGDSEQKQAFKKSLAQTFGDDAIKAMLEQSMNYYPKQSVKTGDTWENKMDINVLFPITITNKWKLLGEKDGLLNIDVQATIKADSKNESVDFMGVKANVNLAGDCKGTINVNKANGITGNGKLVQNMSGEMELLASKSVPESFKMPMKITSNITFETTKQ